MSDTDALLRVLISEVRGLRADIARQAGAPVQADSLAALLDAIASAVGARVFTASELADFAEAAPPEKLLTALHAAGGTSPRKVGKLLRRMEKQELAGWRVLQVGSDRDGIIWKVEPASLGG
ncbi:hypothetical protein FHR70_003750 [Microvirga lupini]|uniref:Uncharacterized protein n=1 Tax=Microvirga lupini TaxID=420324 RepID=A0A7W4VNX2_9HYPH|nr:hypothetical protein [Microvirga lupini]MBB3020664.1 hypothetical protein [Microvirga lupini]